jgi:hypothetical protein
MASPRFLEILRCNGVDQAADPPGMIVPFLGENQVVLETGGIALDIRNATVKLQEFQGRELTTELLRGVQDALSKPDVDPQQRDAFMPDTSWDQPRFFRILGVIKTGFPGTAVNVVPLRTRGGPAPVKLQVAVVERIAIKVAIRNVRARDEQGRMRYHAKRPCDPAKEVAQMNAIWTPQTNVAFELVPSGDLDVDQNDPKTQAELVKAYGLKSPATFQPESTVWADKNWDFFAQHAVPGAQMTFFVVHKLLSGGNKVYGRGGDFPNGVMNRELGLSFIADTRLPSTFAHEAGHYVGNMGHEGTDIRLLMRDDGAGYKIPFKLAEHFRQTFAKRQGKK